MNAFQRYFSRQKEQLRHKQQELQFKLQQWEVTDVYRVRDNEMYDVL